jgi:Zn-dependent protease
VVLAHRSPSRDRCLHGATFLILLLWLGISYYLPQHRMADVISGLTLIVALFGIVILHEMGHALTARRFGIRTRDITLLHRWRRTPGANA